jgi:hypothetical protein
MRSTLPTRRHCVSVKIEVSKVLQTNKVELKYRNRARYCS